MGSTVHNDGVKRIEGRQRTAALLVAGVFAAASTLGACGGDDSSSGSTPTESPAASEDASGSASESPEVTTADYLPVPDGVTLTEPGSELGLKDEAVVAWEPRQDVVGVLEVKVTRVEKTSFAKSFSGWQLDKATKKSTPYFVRAKVTNVGDSDVGTRDVPLYALDSADTLVQAQSFETRFEPCPGDGAFPKVFGAGDSKQLCLVYLVPAGGDLEAVSFRPVQDFVPITWTGDVKDLTKAEKSKKSKKSNDSKKPKNG